MRQEVKNYDSIYQPYSDARNQDEYEDPYRQFHYYGVYGGLMRMRTPQKYLGIKIGDKQAFSRQEMELIRLMVEDSEVYRHSFKEKISDQPDAQKVAQRTGSGVGREIARFVNHPEVALKAQESTEKENETSLEAILIGLMIAKPQQAFILLEQLAAQEVEAQQKQITDSQIDLVDASLTPWMDEKTESVRNTVALRKTVMTRLLRPHLLQLEHVVHAAEKQEYLRWMLNRHPLLKLVGGEGNLSYPHIPLGADRTINYALEEFGFERVRGYRFTEAIEIPAKSVSRRRSRAWVAAVCSRKYPTLYLIKGTFIPSPICGLW